MESKKNPNANLNKYRWPLLVLGLALAGGACLAAIEYIQVDTVYKTKAADVVEDFDIAIDIPIDDEPPPEEEPPPPPPPETPPPPPPPDELEETDDEDEATDADTDINNDAPPPPPPPPPPKPKKVEPMDFPQQEAAFPGGMEGMYKWLGDQIKYPKMAREASIQGKVFVEFVIGTDGKVKSAKILRGIGGGCDEEALRVIKMMPNWVPAEQAGNKVPQRFRLPVFFKLQ